MKKHAKYILAFGILFFGIMVLLWAFLGPHGTTTVGEVSTSWRLFGPNDKIFVNRFADPRVEHVSCYITQARTGGITGAVGLAEDPTNMSVDCRATCVQSVTNPCVKLKETLPAREEIFSERTNAMFKTTNVWRLYDKDENVLIYVVISTHLISGSPVNSTSTVYVDGPTGLQTESGIIATPGVKP